MWWYEDGPSGPAEGRQSCHRLAVEEAEVRGLQRINELHELGNGEGVTRGTGTGYWTSSVAQQAEFGHGVPRSTLAGRHTPVGRGGGGVSACLVMAKRCSKISIFWIFSAGVPWPDLAALEWGRVGLP